MAEEVKYIVVKLHRDGQPHRLPRANAMTLIHIGAASYIEGEEPTVEVPKALDGLRRLIAVITCHNKKFVDKANAQRQTWVKDCEKYGFDVRFFLGVGCQPCGACGDEVYLPVDDGYLGLPAKVQAAAIWAHEQGYDYMLKTDDDVYIVPSRLKHAPVAPHDFVGRFRIPTGEYPAEYASGFGYWLSRKSMEIVGAAKLNGDWAEDRWVANVLAHAGVYGMSDWTNYVAPCPPVVPDVIARTNVHVASVFCQFNAEQIKRMHILFREKQIGPHKAIQLYPAPRYQVTDAQLNHPPSDGAPFRCGGC